ncbi:Dolichyl-phosphate-mannose-protein mannosyltransferase [Roseomonas rosea]|uniref:Dolichyl-phosphate-mannose-protein mannosyltransferase n=1 Tax=Muricoccus roseus TaxID=198092 RepID=A0A1M6JKE9_9PROT|nr:glycosyltransferase family 39 protein [Roseomonas rosea]SHJ47178.1 Dolichyl-phosphate-mannose-protein mannosyltransferase [Roseomonas rosea]
MRRWLTDPWLAALLAVTALRLGAAALLPLSPDEAYYWVWGRDLQPGYLDHPPMVAVWIAAGTALTGDGAFGIRLLGPIGLALASLAVAGAGNALMPRLRPGRWAALLLNAMPVTNAGAVLMTPDTPLFVFWCLALWAVARLHASGDGRWWCAVGGLAGCALLSKYTAVLFGAGLVLWLLAEPTARRWWRDWRLYAGGALAALVFLPVVAWNATHGWASFAKQGGRAGAGREFGLRYVGELVAGQLGLASPILFVLCTVGAALAGHAWARRRDAAAGLLAALTLPAAALFLWQATGSRVQGNWPVVIYPAACIAAAALTALPWQRVGAVLGGVLTALMLVQAGFAPLALPRSADLTLARLGGWPDLARAAEEARLQANAAFIAAEEYGLASELALHLPAGVPVVAIGDRWDLFTLPSPPEGQGGIMLRSLRRGDGPSLWPGAAPIGEITRSRHGVEAERYRVLRVETPAGEQPAALMPRPR